MRLKNLAVAVLFLLLTCFSLGQSRAELDKKELQMLASMEKSQQSAKKSFVAHKTPATQSKYVKLTLDLAQGYETALAIPSAPKYKKAYLLYKDVLKADPTNAKAKKMIAFYDSIYKSLGKPSPKG